MRSFTKSGSPFPPYESSSCCVNGPLIVPVAHCKSDRRHRNGRLTVQTNSAVVPQSTRTVVLQPKKVGSRPSTTSSRVGSARQPKQDDSQKSTELRAGTTNVVSSDTAAKQRSYANSNKSGNDNNSSNSSRQSDFTALHLIDRSSYRPASWQKVELSGVAHSQHNDSSIRRIPVALLMQNGSVKSSQFTVKRHVSSQLSSGFVAAASDNSSRSVTPELRALPADVDAVKLPDHAQNDAFYHQPSVGHANSYEEPVSIKLEKRVVSNTPMMICTLPVSGPAFVCRPLLPETAASTKPGVGRSKTVTRSYHETTRSQRNGSPPVTESGRGSDRRRSATVGGGLPFVGANLWELTTQRLQHAIIDKVSHGLRNEQVSDAAESKTSGEVSSSNSRRTHPRSPSVAEQDHTRVLSKCLSAKTVRPKSELAIRCSQSTSHLLQNCAEEEEEEEEAVDSDDVEL